VSRGSGLRLAAPFRIFALARRPHRGHMAFQAWRNPSSQMMCRRCALLPPADASR
jgi:hypothetical protein